MVLNHQRNPNLGAVHLCSFMQIKHWNEGNIWRAYRVNKHPQGLSTWRVMRMWKYMKFQMRESRSCLENWVCELQTRSPLPSQDHYCSLLSTVYLITKLQWSRFRLNTRILQFTLCCTQATYAAYTSCHLLNHIEKLCNFSRLILEYVYFYPNITKKLN